MTDYTLFADSGDGSNDIYKIAEHLKKCAGGSVNVLGIGPSVGQNYGLSNGKGTVAVFQTNGVGLATPNDFEMGCAPGGYYQYERAIFVWPQWIDNQWMSDENIKKHDIPGEWDWNRAGSYNIGGKTAADWFPNAKYVDLVAGTSPEDVANRICNQVYVTSSGNPGSSNVSSSSGNAGYGTTTEEQSSTSPLLNGEMTFQELIGEICKGIDILFLCKRSTVFVSDFSTIYAEAQYLRENYASAVSGEDIKLYQLEDESYELNVNQHGFYNTVFVIYKNGIVKESFDDFVRVYGEVAVTYSDKKLDKSSAQMKAKAYLAAHVRDFELTVEATILTEPDIDIGDIVTLNNPKTMQNDTKVAAGLKPEYLFVKGVRTEWEGESPITTDLELQYAPTSPDKKEVPTAGICSSSAAKESSSSSSGGSSDSASFDQYGVSKDKTKIMAIGRASASGEVNKYGYSFYKSIFKRKCPFCGSIELHWSIFFAGNESSNWGTFPATGQGEGSSAEGIIHCSGCDADFSCLTGADHESPPRAYLEKISGPTACSKQDAYNLKNGKGG